ncbi:cytochrome c oxidase subunit II [Paenibacillus chartarius]|uniref:Cytochrome c oxidase subunit 2 n=1 Tax=Paenibacillus chartarius TaxID=747481 RepID=A0ABV6DG99_9BACL
MSRVKKLLRLIPLFAVMAFLLAGCGSDRLSALQPQGPVAREQLFLMKLSLSIMVIVVAVVFAIYLWVIVRYRQRKGQENMVPKQVEGSHVLEIIWTAIPIIFLLILAVPTVYYTFQHSADQRANKDAIHVKVTAHQFWWQFDYPDYGIVTAQNMVVPKDKVIALELSSTDVKHSFWVPSLGGKVDTNTGPVNVLYLKADEIGLFQGRCAELCGASHALMNFTVQSYEETEFQKWVDKMKAPVTVAAANKEGETLYKENCMSCHQVSAQGLGLGPNLNGFASRPYIAGILDNQGPEKEENLHKWITNPQDQKPGNKMPAFGQNFGGKLTDAQIDSIAKYLHSLK